MSIFFVKTVLFFFKIQLSISIFNVKNSFISNSSVWCKYSLDIKTVPFQTIQFSFSLQFKRQNSAISDSSV